MSFLYFNVLSSMADLLTNNQLLDRIYHRVPDKQLSVYYYKTKANQSSLKPKKRCLFYYMNA